MHMAHSRNVSHINNENARLRAYPHKFFSLSDELARYAGGAYAIKAEARLGGDGFGYHRLTCAA